MTSITQVRRRASSLDVTAARAARRIVDPFLDSFDGWNRRAALTGALLVSHAITEADKVRYRSDLAELGVEVELAYAQYRLAIAGMPRHSRIDDVEAAFVRLSAVLQRAIRREEADRS